MSKKLLLVFSTFLLNFVLLGQTNKSYKTFDGSVFTEMDTITLGYQTGYKSYKSIKEYYYDSKYSNGYRDVKISLNKLKLPIKSIYQSSEEFNQSKTIVKVGEKGFLKQKYFIDIESAVQNGEVVVKSNNKTELISSLMSQDLAFVNYHVLSNNTLNNSKEEYLFRFKNDLYNKTREDEFEYHSALKTSSNELQSMVNEVDTNKVYSINTAVNLQKYDFDSEGFPINEKDATFLLLKNVRQVLNNSKEDYSQLSISFLNFKNFAFLSYPTEEAKGFISRKKDKYGNVDRKVYIKIFYTVNNATISEDKDRILESKVVKIEVYEFETFQGNFLGEIYDLTK